VGKLAKSSLLRQMKKLNAYPAAAEMLKKCFRHLHLYPEKQAAKCPAREIPPAAVLHQAMQIARDREVVVAKYRETFEKRPLSKSALICPISVSGSNYNPRNIQYIPPVNPPEADRLP